MVDVVVLGTGGHGRETLEVIEAAITDGAAMRVAGFLDDRAGTMGRELHGYPVLGGRDWLLTRPHGSVVAALGIGSPAARSMAARWMAEHRIAVPPLVHPLATVSRRSALPAGALLMSHARISIDVWVGAFAHLNHGCNVSHDCVLGAFATLAPGVTLAGSVTVGEGGELGVGAVAIPGSSIGEWAMVGAGAVVAGAIPANAVATGVPARVQRTREPGWQDRG